MKCFPLSIDPPGVYSLGWDRMTQPIPPHRSPFINWPFSCHADAPIPFPADCPPPSLWSWDWSPNALITFDSFRASAIHVGVSTRNISTEKLKLRFSGGCSNLRQLATCLRWFGVKVKKIGEQNRQTMAVIAAHHERSRRSSMLLSLTGFAMGPFPRG